MNIKNYMEAHHTSIILFLNIWISDEREEENRKVYKPCLHNVYMEYKYFRLRFETWKRLKKVFPPLDKDETFSNYIDRLAVEVKNGR